jgi:hydrogenase maturation factor
MTPDVEVGAWVLVAAGNVVRRIDAGEASCLASQLDAAMATLADPEPRPGDRAATPARSGGSR